HAERPYAGWRGALQRWGLRSTDAFLFAAHALADPWIEEGYISSKERVFQIMEGSTGFQWQPRASARAATGLYGEPVFLWVGHLIPRKDPLTVLAAFEQLLLQVPRARLYIIYGTDDLLPQVQARLTQSTVLREAVTLLGQLPHAALESYYNSADYFVLGSHYEGSGYALVEALACGVVPIVTDIPSFRMMTDEGRLGALWTVGDSNSLLHTAVETLKEALAPKSAAARHFFEERLSFPALGRQAMEIYRATQQKQKHGGTSSE
ncbi:MAG: glycosyltransferase, partial [Ardenticatenales bacterium]|nr:glycosyltransferase [Ardenticatenales bacterium]